MKTLGSILKARELYTISADETTLDAARYMAAHSIGAVPVLDGERVVGLFTERDLMKRVVAEGRSPAAVQVRDAMTTNLTTARPDESYAEGIRKMYWARCRHLPIIENNKLVGLLSLRDLLEVDADEKADEIRFLNTYIHYVPPNLTDGP